MKEQIKNYLIENKNISLAKVSKDLGISFMEVLRQSPDEYSKSYPVEKIDELFEKLNSWEQVLMLVVTESFVLEIKDKFPKGKYGHGYLNFGDKESSIGGHLSVGNIKDIFIVNDIMFGRKSCSIKFFDTNEKEIFAVYVPRDEKGQLIEKYLNEFNSL
ncbi:heme utilization cystosolic carrier protein HutX [Fusobacterium sp.]|uniref:heme utilization cystosolic carrier protein HutX n=1 Tax=Fusobacterium sp. TaxID=68766 RepID=UPI0026341ADC|nr:heme utilization cystosolic carrier protein HutX [Fusobacterium sp.]